MKDEKGRNVQKEKKAIKRKHLSIIVSLAIVTIVITAGMMVYTKNNSVVYNNKEITNENGGSGINSRENNYMQLSNYVIAGSDEAKRNEEMLKEALEEERLKNIQKETEGNIKEEGTKYASQDIVKLASNGGNVPKTMALLDITGGELTLDKTTYTYNGQRNVPNPTLKVGGQTLILGKDYTIEYENNINAGTATAIAKGINDYSGTKETSFTISAKTITVEVEGETQFAYDGAEHKPTVKSPIEGENGDKIYLKLNVTGNVTPIKPGDYMAEVEIERIEKGEVKAEPGTITVSNTITTDETGNNPAEDKVKKGTRLYIQIEANQVNGKIKSVYANGKYLPINASGQYYLKITENGEYGFAVVGSENTSEYYTVTVTNYIENQIELGDYVKYTSDKATDASWRVWKIDEANNKVIIAPTSKVGSLALSLATGSNGWINAETAIENLCDKYISSSLGITVADVRSMKIEDIEEVMLKTEVEQAKNYNYGIEQQFGGTFYAEKAAAGELTFDGYNKEVNSGKTGTVTVVNTDWSKDSPTWNSLNNSKDGMTTHTYGSILGSTYSWLASRCLGVSSSNADFFVRIVNSEHVSHAWLYNSGRSTGGETYGVRPLVYLSVEMFNGGGDGTKNNPWQLEAKKTESKVEVGDYVKYAPNSTVNANWRVWKIDNNKIIITPTSPLGTLELRGAKGGTGWVNAETAIENECDKYISNSLEITADDVRSMKIEDIEEVMLATEVGDAKKSWSYGSPAAIYTDGTFYAEQAENRRANI